MDISKIVRFTVFGLRPDGTEFRQVFEGADAATKSNEKFDEIANSGEYVVGVALGTERNFTVHGLGVFGQGEPGESPESVQDRLLGAVHYAETETARASAAIRQAMGMPEPSETPNDETPNPGAVVPQPVAARYPSHGSCNGDSSQIRSVLQRLAVNASKTR